MCETSASIRQAAPCFGWGGDEGCRWGWGSQQTQTSTQCWSTVGPPSTTSAQQWTNIGWTSRVCQLWLTGKESTAALSVHFGLFVCIDWRAHISAYATRLWPCAYYRYSHTTSWWGWCVVCTRFAEWDRHLWFVSACVALASPSRVELRSYCGWCMRCIVLPHTLRERERER